ncbi:MAG TPA: DUF4350 domain-containing protein [Thermoanaerobaculia bacterium]
MRNQRLLRITIAVVIVAILGGATWFFFDNFKRVEVDEETGYQGAARVNPLLAAERLYTSLGAPARTLPGALETLPPTDHAILLVSERRSINEQQMNALKDWVKGGGRLVVAVDEAPSLDPILAWLGVRVQGEQEKEKEKEPGSEVLPMKSRSGPAPIEAPKVPRLVDSRNAANFVVGSTAGKFLLRFYEGQGRVIVLSDATFLTNHEIGKNGHARAAWAIVNAETPPKGVWIVVHEDMPTLLGLRRVMPGRPRRAASFSSAPGCGVPAPASARSRPIRHATAAACWSTSKRLATCCSASAAVKISRKVSVPR